jgi:hexosaminidase
MFNLIPKPVSVTPATGFFVLKETTRVAISPANSELELTARQIADAFALRGGGVISTKDAKEGDGLISLSLENDMDAGTEGYELEVAPEGASIRAGSAAGLFYGAQTFLQLAPVGGNLREIQACTIRDAPRFGWRGAMLDVARHFFRLEDVKRYIDLLAHYKMNRLHLHLTDDQGWRIEIKSWNQLSTIGGSSAVGGGAGGYYTQEEYAELVNYAAERHITIVPEIDMPGHTNAALASYPELNCDNVSPPLYTGTEVGFSTLCTDKELTYKFVDDVIRELAALTPGPYIHIGGDEARATRGDDYIRFVERVQAIVRAHGKQMVGWEEIAQARLLPTTLVQQWTGDFAARAPDQGAALILSPASLSYLDMKYDETTPLGLDWAGMIDVEKSYSWEPSQVLEDAGEEDIAGVEAPLWSETIVTRQDLEYMAFPRLLGIAEIGWSPAKGRDRHEYFKRLGAHGARLEAMGVNFYRAPGVPW